LINSKTWKQQPNRQPQSFKNANKNSLEQSLERILPFQKSCFKIRVKGLEMETKRAKGTHAITMEER
jgi:hypothetical protein